MSPKALDTLGDVLLIIGIIGFIVALTGGNRAIMLASTVFGLAAAIVKFIVSRSRPDEPIR